MFLNGEALVVKLQGFSDGRDDIAVRLKAETGEMVADFLERVAGVSSGLPFVACSHVVISDAGYDGRTCKQRYGQFTDQRAWLLMSLRGWQGSFAVLSNGDMFDNAFSSAYAYRSMIIGDKDYGTAPDHYVEACGPTKLTTHFDPAACAKAIAAVSNADVNLHTSWLRMAARCGIDSVLEPLAHVLLDALDDYKNGKIPLRHVARDDWALNFK